MVRVFWKTLNWFSSYISDRKQSVKIGSTLSDPAVLKFGSVLGPILFSLYTSPLNKIISACTLVKFHFYADDAQLYVHLSFKYTSVAISQLHSCLKDVQAWMGTNKLKLNPDKTEFILFGSKSQRKSWQIIFQLTYLVVNSVPEM